MLSVRSVSLLVTLVGNLLSFSAHIGDLCSVFCLNEEVGKYSIVSRNNCCFSVCDNGRASVSGLWKMLCCTINVCLQNLHSYESG